MSKRDLATQQSEQPHQAPAGGFKRVLALPALVFFGLAYMIPLTVWTTYGVVTTMTSGHLAAAYIVTTVAMLFTAYSYMRMVRAFPVAGSTYSYSSRVFGRPAGFLVGWALMLDYMLLPMLSFLVIGLYMNAYFPAVSAWMWIVSSIVIITVLGVVGVKVVTRFNVVLVSAQFVFIAVFVTLSIQTIISSEEKPEVFSPFGISTGQIDPTIAGAAILALSFLGFDAVATLAEETDQPRTKVPKAILLCAGCSGLIYIGQAWIAQLAFPEYQSFANHQDVASSDVMLAVGGEFLNTFFTAVYITACFACGLASQTSVSRILFAMSRDGSLPRGLFGHLHQRFHTPVTAVVFVGAVGLLALVIDLDSMASIISFGALVAFSAVNVATAKYYVIDNSRRTPKDLVVYGAIPIIGTLFTLYLWTQLSQLAFTVGLIWVGAGFVLLLVLTRGFRRRPSALVLDEEGEPVTGTASSQR